MYSPTALNDFLREVPFTVGVVGKQYQLAGVVWKRIRDEGPLYHFVATPCEVLLKLDVNGDGKFQWEYSRQLYEDEAADRRRYLRATGVAESLEAAAAVALAFQPQELKAEYQGQTITWYQSRLTEKKHQIWTAVMNGDLVQVFEHCEGAGWQREYTEGAEVLGLVNSECLKGVAPSRDAAMQAALEAPAAFVAACKRLLGTTWREQDVRAQVETLRQLQRPPGGEAA